MGEHVVRITVSPGQNSGKPKNLWGGQRVRSWQRRQVETERYWRILGGQQCWAGLGLGSGPEQGPRDLATWGTSASWGEATLQVGRSQAERVELVGERRWRHRAHAFLWWRFLSGGGELISYRRM